MKKRLISMALAVSMAVSIMPAPALATVGGGGLNDTVAHTILDFQLSAIDVKRSLVICRCNGVAVQINAQYFIIDRESVC